MGGMFSKDDVGDDIKYVFEPPNWVKVAVVLIGLIAGLFWGIYLIGWGLIGLAYYFRMALGVAAASLTSLFVLALGIVVLILLRGKFEIGFSLFLLFLIAILIGAFVGLTLQFTGYAHLTEPPFEIPSPEGVLDGDNSSDNSTVNGTVGNGTRITSMSMSASSTFDDLHFKNPMIANIQNFGKNCI